MKILSSIASFIRLLPPSAALLFSCCGDEQPTLSVLPRQEEPREYVERFFSPVPDKETAVDVAAARCLKPGEHILVRGRILGAERLFEEEQAMFLLADPAYVTPDECGPHPWRASGVSSSVKRVHMLTVQMIGGNGRLLACGLKGLHGLKAEAFVVVSGVMDAETTSSSPVVDAEAVEVIDAWPMLAPEAGEAETSRPWGDEGSPCPTCSGRVR